MDDDDFHLRPGRPADAGSGDWRKAKSLVGRVLQASRKAGVIPLSRGTSARGTGRRSRGKSAALATARSRFQRRVIVKGRVVRHRGARWRSAPLARHVAYLERDGVAGEGGHGELFNASGDEADGGEFAARCEDDRHHFRFIVSPEDAADLADLRTFTRELMGDMARDLGTHLDWVAVDHWNTQHPHIHVLVRGASADGSDLVIDRSYMSRGLRARAEERATIELGPRSERELAASLRLEVEAERWTSLDRRLRARCDETGLLDLGPAGRAGERRDIQLLVGRARTLERMELAQPQGPLRWQLSPDLEPTLRTLGDRGDIIRSMHRAMSAAGAPADQARFSLLDNASEASATGRLVERGLHDELSGEAYVIVDGVDGRTHYLRFPNLEATGDAKPGAIVETTRWTDRNGRSRPGLQLRSDLEIGMQIGAEGSTWLDRQLISPTPVKLSDGFGAEVEKALSQRSEVLIDRGLATRKGPSIVFSADLLDTLRRAELETAGIRISEKYGAEAALPTAGSVVSGVYRERADLASGRFAVIEGDSGLRLVPWRRDLEQHLGQTVSGSVTARGSIDWSFARNRGPSI